MRPTKFIQAVQGRAARVTLGASALRSQGPGVADAARPFLATLSLAPFAVSSGRVFAKRLDQATVALQATFPHGSGSWGLARKLLNIFLREALYTRYLAERYQLAKAEASFELPLDSITARRLLELRGAHLPRWPGVKHLSPEASYKYQVAAAAHAADLGISRVHLDAIWWGGPRNKNTGEAARLERRHRIC